MKLTDEELELFYSPADKSAHENPYTTNAKYMCYDMQDGSGIGGCDLSATTDLTCATLIIRKPNDDTVYVLQQYPGLPDDRHTADELKEMIAETLKENDNSDDDKDKDTKKESDDGTDAN